MKPMFKCLSLVAVLVVAASPAARASEVFNSSLTQGPGVYYGTGNVNAGFDVVTDGTLQLGLAAITRYVGPNLPTTNNTYMYTPGPGTPAANANDALWDYEFSVNTGTAPLSTYSYLITIDDLTNGHSFSYNPTLVPDNGQSNGLTVVCNGNPSCAFNPANTGFQNAENLGFTGLAGPLAFNPNAADTYRITLSATSGGTTVNDVINVVPTPEPSSLVFLGTGLVGAVGKLLRRRRVA